MTAISKGILGQFHDWFQQAQGHPQVPLAEAMHLSTADDKGSVSSRMVLLKGIDERGFVFFTNYHSRKSAALRENPKAALSFYWAPLSRQIHIEGRVEKTSDAESDAYFASRPRESQIGAWASNQSEALESREVLLARFNEVEAKFAEKDIPRPPHWGGYRIMPNRVEFWQEGSHRLHERVVWSLESGVWSQRLLNP